VAVRAARAAAAAVLLAAVLMAGLKVGGWCWEGEGLGEASDRLSWVLVWGVVVEGGWMRVAEVAGLNCSWQWVLMRSRLRHLARRFWNQT